MTSEKRQAMQSRTFSQIEVPDLMQLVGDALRNSGYQVVTSDRERGVVVGTLLPQNPLQHTTRFGRDSFQATRQGERIEAMVNIRAGDAADSASSTSTIVRIALTLLPEYNLGVMRGEEIIDPKPYRRFFELVQTAIKKRSEIQSRSEGREKSPR